MLLVIDLEIAPKKKTPIIAQIILSKAIVGEKPCPELIISESGSKGSKFKLTNNNNYKGFRNEKLKLKEKLKPSNNLNTKKTIQCYLQVVIFFKTCKLT